MLRLAANISMLFTEVPFLERVARAAQAGFAAVECQFPYEQPAEALRARLVDEGVQLVLHNVPPGDWAAGDRGLACHPLRVDEFRASVERGLEYASTLGCGQLNCLVGLLPADTSADAAHDTLVSNLTYAADQAGSADIRLLIEPINTRDMPGYVLNHTRDARALIREVGSSNLFLQYDCYHMQIMEGDLARTLETHLDLIRHIQIADAPLRSEPGTGEINFAFLFDHLDRLGYDGWIGAEYRPLGRTEDGLGWIGRSVWR